MNLIQQGAHAGADWLGYKIRARKGRISLHVLANGEMVTRDASRDKKVNEPSFAGVYSQQNWRYTDIAEELNFLRNQLLEQREATA